MARALLICAVAMLACGCGNAPPDQKHEARPPSDTTATPTVTPAADKAPALPAVSSPPRTNKYLQMAVTEAGFDPAAPGAPPGLGYYTVGLKGVGRARGNDFVLETKRFLFAQDDRGCIGRAVDGSAWLKRPIGEAPIFRVSEPTEGQVAFLVPADSQRLRLLIAPTGEGALVMPVGQEFKPSWPAPIQMIEDGSTLRVLVLPALESSPSAANGRVMMDYVIENLSTEQGIEFTTSQQLRLVDQSGKFVQPSGATKQIGCRLDDGDVIPPGFCLPGSGVVCLLSIGAKVEAQHQPWEGI
jgi:hypothetical protein